MRTHVTTTAGEQLTANLIGVRTAGGVATVLGSPSNTPIEFSHVWRATPSGGTEGVYDLWTACRGSVVDIRPVWTGSRR